MANQVLSTRIHFLSRRSLFLAAMFLLPAAAQANMVWYGSFLTARYYAVWPILAGLLIEFIVLGWVTDLSFPRLLGATLAMNFLSAVAGFWLMLFSTLASELFLGYFLRWDSRVAHHAGVVVVAAAANTLIEFPTVLVFRPSTPRKKLFYWLWFANILSVAAAAVSLYFYPYTYP